MGKFGPTGQGQRRDGIDIAAAKGSPVLAAEDGVVVYAGEGVGSYGRLILLRHDGDYITTYAHKRRAPGRGGRRGPGAVR